MRHLMFSQCWSWGSQSSWIRILCRFEQFCCFHLHVQGKQEGRELFHSHIKKEGSFVMPRTTRLTTEWQIQGDRTFIYIDNAFSLRHAQWSGHKRVALMVTNGAFLPQNLQFKFRPSTQEIWNFREFLSLKEHARMPKYISPVICNVVRHTA